MKKKLLINERGSMGIETVLLGFFFLIFLLMPLYFFLYEQYYYSMRANVCAGNLDNALDQIEWNLQTESLASAQRYLSTGEMKEALKREMASMPEMVLKEILVEEIYKEGLPQVSIRVALKYPAKTIVGEILEPDGYLTMTFCRQRELPYDR